MLSAQDIHDHLTKYTKIPESWRSKNYAFKEYINSVIEKQLLNELLKFRFHTLIVDKYSILLLTTVLKVKLSELSHDTY
jgi:hypothetical protein